MEDPEKLEGAFFIVDSGNANGQEREPALIKLCAEP
jgi:hypothetical protein